MPVCECVGAGGAVSVVASCHAHALLLLVHRLPPSPSLSRTCSRCRRRASTLQPTCCSHAEKEARIERERAAQQEELRQRAAEREAAQRRAKQEKKRKEERKLAQLRRKVAEKEDRTRRFLDAKEQDDEMKRQQEAEREEYRARVKAEAERAKAERAQVRQLWVGAQRASARGEGRSLGAGWRVGLGGGPALAWWPFAHGLLDPLPLPFPALCRPVRVTRRRRSWSAARRRRRSWRPPSSPARRSWP